MNLITLAISSYLALAGEPHSDIRIEAKCRAEVPSTLTFSITNVGTQPIEVPEAAMPWRYASDPVFSVVARSRGKELESSGILGYFIDRRTLDQGESVSGEILLDDRFPKLRRAVRAGREVEIEWTARFDQYLKLRASPVSGKWRLTRKTCVAVKSAKD